MAVGKNLLSRVPNHFVKTITFDGTSGLGLVNVSVLVASVTGRVLIREIAIACRASLAGATATISLGTSGNTAAIIAATTATDIDLDEFWRDTSPESQVAAAIKDTIVLTNLVYEPLTATISSGALEFSCFWLPLSVDGNLS